MKTTTLHFAGNPRSCCETRLRLSILLESALPSFPLSSRRNFLPAPPLSSSPVGDWAPEWEEGVSHHWRFYSYICGKCSLFDFLCGNAMAELVTNNSAVWECFPWIRRQEKCVQVRNFKCCCVNKQVSCQCVFPESRGGISKK